MINKMELDLSGTSITMDVVVVTYNSWKTASREILSMIDISRCLPSVHWIFVDNSPGGEDAVNISANLSGNESLTLVTSATNLGFAAGCNLGVTHGTADWVCFINPDITVSLPDIQNILMRISQDDVADSIAIGQVTRGFSHTGIGSTPYLWFTDRPTNGRMKLIGPSGGAGVYKRRLFTDHGGFYEPLFAWGEDADLAMRLRRAGVSCEPLELGLVHQGQHSVSTGKAPQRFKARLLSRNRLWVTKRNLNSIQVGAFVVIHAGLILLQSVRNLRRGTGKASWQGYVEGLKIIFGSKDPASKASVRV